MRASTAVVNRFALFSLFLAVAVVVTGGAFEAGEKSASWTQWGGPNQDFKAASEGLAKKWPAEGPKKLWSRDLGDGYSAILAEGGRLYTMYRVEEREAVICLDAETGKTVWERRYDASPAEGHIAQFGEGPRSTPLLVGDQLFTIGVSGKMHALDKNDGKVLWSHDLWGEFGGNHLDHGYSSSPIAYKDTIIVLVGGEGQSIVAFKKKDGEIDWKNQSFKNSYGTPRIFEIAGKDVLVTFMAEELVGLDPDTGELKWRYAHENQWGQNISPPVLAGGQYLFFSSPEAGARGLKLSREGDDINVEEIWSTRKIQFYHVTTVLDGDYVYGSTGTMAPAFMAALNVKTGEIAWRKRGFAKANCVYADGRLVILDEDGKLYLTTATPDDLVVHSEVQLLDEVSWTVPTIVGRTMFVRDKTSVLALDLG